MSKGGLKEQLSVRLQIVASIEHPIEEPQTNHQAITYDVLCQKNCVRKFDCAPFKNTGWRYTLNSNEPNYKSRLYFPRYVWINTRKIQGFLLFLGAFRSAYSSVYDSPRQKLFVQIFSLLENRTHGYPFRCFARFRVHEFLQLWTNIVVVTGIRWVGICTGRICD